MEALLELYLKASLSGSVIILLILLLRLILRKAPRQLMCILWALVAVRLLLPFQIESPFSLQPVCPEALIGGLTGNKLLPVLYMIIAVFALAYGMAAYLRLKRKVQNAVENDDGVLEAEGIQSAFVLGYIRPKIYLPLFLQPGDRHHIVAHEKAHILRGDNWWKLLGFVCLCLHWYNPLVWVAYTLFCRDTEVACDERIVWGMDLEKRKEYTYALLNSGKRASGLPALVLCFGKESLKQRIRNVLSYRKPGLVITAITGMLVVLVGICFMTTPVRGSTEPAGDSQITATEATTEDATEEVTGEATEEPTQSPTQAPTEAPTEKPTESPTEAPTEAPTEVLIPLSGTCGDSATWAFDETTGQLTVSGGALTDYRDERSQPWAAVRERIKKLVIAEGVTHIGAFNFAKCAALRSVTIPASVTRIERYAFEKCTGLSELIFAPNTQIQTIGRLAFANSGIKEFTAPENLRLIEQRAFNNCSALQKLSLMGGALTVEAWAFENCTGLKTLLLGESVELHSWQSPFSGCTSIEYMESYLDSVGTMRLCQSSKSALKTYVMRGIHEGLGGFEGCTALTTVRIEAVVEEIYWDAFRGCTSLKTLDIPDTVKQIYDNAFADSGLEEVTIPASVERVGMCAFENCPLKKIVFLGCNPPMNVDTFRGVTITVYYPANSSKWEEQRKADIYPTVTWVAMQ